MSREAWTLVGTGFITGTTTGVDVPVSSFVPNDTYTYAVSITNLATGVRAFYIEPPVRSLGVTASLGIPLKADADATNVFSPRRGADVTTWGNPQVWTSGSTAPCSFQIYYRTQE